MSTKFSLTEAGVKTLLNELYLLPDPELQAEADELLINFCAWVIAHFELSEEQVADVVHLPAMAVQFMAASISFAIRNRLVVHLNKGVKQAGKGNPEYKVIKTTNNLKVAAYSAEPPSKDSEQDCVPEGEVTVHIYYL